MKKILTIIGATLALSMPAAAATIVQNGSFEQGHSNDKGWIVYDSITGWETTSGPGIEVQGWDGISEVDAQDGSFYVELDSHNGNDTNSAMKQVVNLAVGLYKLSFWYSPRVNSDKEETNRIDYSITGASVTNGSGFVSGPNAGPPVTTVGKWTEIVNLFTVNIAGNYDLNFAAKGKDESVGGLIDNVAIAAVPAPAAALLLLTAVGGLGIARRFRKA